MIQDLNLSVGQKQLKCNFAKIQGAVF